jgi:HipA-like kinase
VSRQPPWRPVPSPRMSTRTEPTLPDVAAIRYVTPLREGGSLPGLVEADDDGLYVVKFRGAGQGLRALVAEVIVGELARRLGLLVPDLVTLEIDPALGAAEPDPEIQDLIAASAGANLGVDFLPGSLSYTPGGPYRPGERLSADIVWLDALTTNVDRTPRNPNLLIWHDRLWLIDHGAALYLHHGGLDPVQHADRPFPLVNDHVLLPHAGSILEAHERLAPTLDPATIQRTVALVPDDWLAATGDARETYVDYLTRRLENARFAEEAERARLDA